MSENSGGGGNCILRSQETGSFIGVWDWGIGIGNTIGFIYGSLIPCLDGCSGDTLLFSPMVGLGLVFWFDLS